MQNEQHFDKKNTTFAEGKNPFMKRKGPLQKIVLNTGCTSQNFLRLVLNNNLYVLMKIHCEISPLELTKL